MTKYHPAVSKVQMQLPNPSSCQLAAWDRRWGRAGQQDGQEYQRKDMVDYLRVDLVFVGATVLRNADKSSGVVKPFQGNVGQVLGVAGIAYKVGSFRRPGFCD